MSKNKNRQNETPVVETPVVETPPVETPVVETLPVVETPPVATEIDPETALKTKIVEMREAGHIWWEIDQALFPGQVDKHASQHGKSPSWKMAKKFNLPAFSKRVYGCFTHTQVVEKLRTFGKRIKPVAEAAPQIAGDVVLAGLMG